MASTTTSVNFKVDSQPFPIEPKRATVTYQDLDGESERNANGKLVRQVIRTGVVKVELEFGVLTTAQAGQILNMLNKTKFSFSYPDPKKQAEGHLSEAYCGDRQLGYLRTLSNGTAMYDSLTVSIIEY